MGCGEPSHHRRLGSVKFGSPRLSTLAINSDSRMFSAIAIPKTVSIWESPAAHSRCLTVFV
jgi:hypothetical protein